MKSFGENVHDLRRAAGLTQPKFAAILSSRTGQKITRSAVSMWELGQRTPKMDVIAQIADYFNVTTDALLGREEDRSPVELAMEIALIARAGTKMTQGQRELLLRWAKMSFPDAFKED